MKKLLLSTIVLLAFSCALIIFQLSCKKSADASTTNNSNTTAVQQLGKLIIAKNVSVASTNTVNYEIWSTNYDGSAAQKVNVVLPDKVTIDSDNIRLSPDGKLLFFHTATTDSRGYSLAPYRFYSCNIDGSNPQPINFGDTNTYNAIEVAY